MGNGAGRSGTKLSHINISVVDFKKSYEQKQGIE
jgi:hypothetical protein